jgi:hypothetical protein
MVRRIMILILILLIGYIFYEEFVADSFEPFLKKYGKKPLFYQVRVPKIASEDQPLQ